jgi:hypothetical protein
MVNPTEPKQIELKPQTTRRVRAELGRVVVRFELASAANVGSIQHIELVLTPRNAAELGVELTTAAQKLA